MLMMIKIRYRLPYRGLEGFSKWIFARVQKKLKIPTYSLICKRAQKMKMPKLSHRRPEIIILDASGVKVAGEGEWKVRIHGKSKRRKWIKIHIAIDAKTQEVVAELTTEGYVADSSVTELLLDQVHGSVKTVMADGGYDRAQSREVIRQKKLKALIPPPRNARHRRKNDDRDRAISEIKGLGGDEDARRLWGKLTGYNRRVLVESAFSQMKGLFGASLFSKRTDSQMVENRLRCVLMNKMRQMTN